MVRFEPRSVVSAPSTIHVFELLRAPLTEMETTLACPSGLVVPT
jgi:hypothetical protein